MANVPSWFNAAAYFQNKLASMEGYNELTLKAAFEAAGYNVDNSESMYGHFESYGNREGVSPNALFNVDQYLRAKAIDFYGTTNVTENQVKSMMLAMENVDLSPWQHFLEFGAKEGINPSAAFDSAAYMQEKLAQMQADPEYGPTYTMADLEAAFDAVGLNALTHYFAYGRDEGLKPIAGTNPGVTSNLTSGDDSAFGSAGDDYFYAGIGTLNTNDYVDGLEGNDTLYAMVDESNVATRPTIQNVEKIIFSAQGQVTEDTGENNISYSRDNWNVSIDADQISKGSAPKQIFENKDSRADFAIEDIRINSNETVISFSNADSGDVDFGVFFDDQHLKSDSASTTATLVLKLMDVKNADPDYTPSVAPHPLQENYFDGFSFAYIPDGGGAAKVVQLQFRAADKGLYSGESATYATLLEAFQNALTDWLAGNPSYDGKISIAQGVKFEAAANVDGIDYSAIGDAININVTGGKISVDKADPTYGNEVGWRVFSGVVPSDVRIVAEAAAPSFTDCPLIQTEIWLDNVGRVQWNDAAPNCLPADAIFGSEAGDLVVGGMSKHSGVERFDIKVDQGSWLSSISSTNNKLRYISVVNEDTNGDGVNGNLGVLANNENAQFGQLFIGDTALKEDGNIKDWADALDPRNPAGAPGSWVDMPKLLSTDGLTDVKWFDGTLFEGNINMGAQITSESYAKYLASVDDVKNVDQNFAPKGEFKYALGSGNDTLNMVVNSGIAADNDFKLVIDGGAGNDFINFQYSGALTTNQLANMKALQNVVIDGGAGDDTIKSWGDGVIKVNGGAGNDAIYVGQDATDQNAVWVFNVGGTGADAADKAIYVDAVNGAQPLDNDLSGDLSTILFAKGALTAGTELLVNIDFLGFTTQVSLYTLTAADIAAAGPNISLTTRQVNQAIIKAISEDPTLSKLLIAKDGAGDSLIIESLIDGDFSSLTDMITFKSQNGNTVADWDPTVADIYETQFATVSEDVTDSVAISSLGSNTEPLTVALDYADAGLADGDYLAIQIGDKTYYAETALATDGTAANVVTALLTAVAADGEALTDLYTVAAGAGGAGGSDLTITAKNPGLQSVTNDDFALFEVGSAEATGDGDGTTSHNIVNGGAGDDVLVLNVGSTANAYFDTLVIDGAMGNDVVYGFQTTIDKIDVSAFGSLVAVEANGTLVDGQLTMTNILAALNTGATFNTAGANTKGAALIQHGATDTYTVVSVNNADTDGLVESEVTILGTITFSDGTTVVDGDLVGA